MSDWAWEYFPDAQHVTGDTPNLALIAQIEERADVFGCRRAAY
ncbi:hypothetical protein ACFOSC_17800 [Streptantibioticus rubrisoli]|nr:hypothetical protein [Streptantibioticus rubrisoli]